MERGVEARGMAVEVLWFVACIDDEHKTNRCGGGVAGETRHTTG